MAKPKPDGIENSAIAVMGRETVLRVARGANQQWKENYGALSHSRTLGPDVLALDGGAARRPLALAPRRHRTGDGMYRRASVVANA
jgi:hypothetical protein